MITKNLIVENLLPIPLKSIFAKKLIKTDRMTRNKKMTTHEKQIMGLLWNTKGQKATINELLDMFPEPKPAYTTLATFLRIMTQKGFVKNKKCDGMRNYVFYPAISKSEYLKYEANEMKDTFFGGSFKSLVSFFVKNENLSEKEQQDIIDLINSK